MQKQAGQYTTKEDLPLILQARHIAEILGISKPTVYAMMKRADFPALRGVWEKRTVVPRDLFFQWLERQAGNQSDALNAAGR